MSLDFKLRRSLAGLSHAASMWLPVWMSPLDPKDMAELFEMPLRPEEVYSEAIALWECDPRKSTVDRALEFFTQFYLSGRHPDEGRPRRHDGVAGNARSFPR